MSADQLTRNLSDLADIRSRNIIHKEDCGTLMFIPREAGMVRIYVQLNEEDAKSSPTTDPTTTLATASRILEPYTLATKSVYWSAKYRVQQLLASSYSAFEDRLFIMGDAAHTHSPKAGMGMNMSIQDAYNLAWKLAAVIRRDASPQLLKTYELERRPIAQSLLEFDRDFNTLFHSPLSDCTPEEYQAAIIEAISKESGDISGVAAQYLDQQTSDQPAFCRQHLADRIKIGRRIPHGTFVNHADGRATNIHDVLPSNDQWHLFVFPGDLRDSTKRDRLKKLAQVLGTHDSPLLSFTSQRPGGRSLVEVFTVHASPRHSIDLLDLPDIFHPWDPELGWDYGKVFTDEKSYQNPVDTGHLYRDFGIADERCCVLLRPDQHVCMISRIEDAAELCTLYLSRWYHKNARRDSLSPSWL
jgi:phenol 2-monooxygenase